MRQKRYTPMPLKKTQDKGESKENFKKEKST